MGDCCGCDVDTSQLEAAQRRVLVIVLLVNVVTFLGMVAASWLSGSAALLSGTLDNLGDALTYGFSLAVVGGSIASKARVTLFKGALISIAALAVLVQLGWRVLHMDVPVVATMSIAAALNLGANVACLLLLAPHRHDDMNMASVFECSRNDVFEGVAVLVTAAAVWFTDSALPDLLVAAVLLVLFSRSAFRVLSSGLSGMREARTAPA